MDESTLEAPIDIPVSAVRNQPFVTLQLRFSLDGATPVTPEEMLDALRVEQEVLVPKLPEHPTQAEADEWLENPVLTGKRFPCVILSRSQSGYENCKVTVEPVSNEPTRGQMITFWACLTVLR